MRRRAAAPRARRQLRDAATPRGRPGSVREAADHVQDSLAGLVADVADLARRRLTPKDVLRQFAGSGAVDESLIARVRRFWMPATRPATAGQPPPAACAKKPSRSWKR